jgi:hypothetical protein
MVAVSGFLYGRSILALVLLSFLFVPTGNWVPKTKTTANSNNKTSNNDITSHSAVSLQHAEEAGHYSPPMSKPSVQQ